MVADNYTRGEQVNASIDGIGLLEGLITKFSSFDYSIRSTSWLVLMQPRNRAGYQDQTPGAAVKVVMTDDGTYVTCKTQPYVYVHAATAVHQSC